MKTNTDLQMRADLTVTVPPEKLQHRVQKAGQILANLLRSFLFVKLLAIAALPLSFFALLLELDSEEDD